MSVKGLSDFDQYGNYEKYPVWPFKCEFRPNDPCNFPDEWHGSYLDNLTNGCVYPGHTLFDLWCMEEPEKLGGYFYHIGKIVTTSDMVTSMYGDTKLFFRHVRFEEDLDKKPEWLPHIEMFDRSTFVNNLPLPLESPAECPFDYLFGMM